MIIQSTHERCAVHQFNDLETAPFSPQDYSRLKFGADKVAHQYGKAIAARLFEKYAADLLINKCVIIPSPYNHVYNAATLVAHHAVAHLNHLLVSARGTHCEYSTIHRKVSYINDYGYLTGDQRKKLIDGDEFYFNPEFYKDKILIFIDDVRITGTHEIKLVELLDEHRIENRCIFAYYAVYDGVQADVEAALNFAAIKDVKDFAKLLVSDDHKMIVRPIKYILGKLTEAECKQLLKIMTPSQIITLYNGCLGEGYYRIPAYQNNFHLISTMHYSVAG